MANPMPQSVDKHDRHDREGRDLLAAARIGSVEALGALFESMRGHLRLAARRELPRSIRGAVSASDLVQAAQTVPMSVTAGDSIESLRQWASGRCLSADRAEVYSRAEVGGGRGRRVMRELGVN
ncbi:MAG: hypothetical protein WCJ31_14270 [Planctomycetia bacterium]